MNILIANHAAAGGDPTDPPLTTPPVGVFSTLPEMVNHTTDQTAPDGPGLPPDQNGIIRVDQTVGGTTMRKNIVTFVTGGIGKRPQPFTRESWQGMPTPFNRLQGRVGYQSAAADLRTRVAVQDATVIPTTAETTAAFVNPGLINALNVQRGGRFSN